MTQRTFYPPATKRNDAWNLWSGLGYVPDRITRGTNSGPPGGSGSGSGLITVTGPGSGVSIDLSPAAIALLGQIGMGMLQQGQDGEDGLTIPGPPGNTGLTGPAGAVGANGMPGTDGLDGDDGWIIPGGIGAFGPQGIMGFPGFDGDQGDDGFPIPGLNGTNGTNGTNGAVGAQGPAGFGIDGVDGDDASPIIPAGVAYVNFPNTFLLPEAINLSAVNTTPLIISGGSITGSSTVSPGLTITGTLNTSGVASGIALNLTNTAVGAGGGFFVGNGGVAGATFRIGIDINGNIRTNGSLLTGVSSISGAGPIDVGASSAGFVSTQAAGGYRWSSTSASNGTADTFFTRRAAATTQHGAADAASPVAQTITTQGSRGGTDTNVGGGQLTIQSGLGTGTGTLSILSLQAPVAAASGTTQQTATEGLAIKNGYARLKVYHTAALPASPDDGALAMVDDATLTAITGLGLAPTGGGGNKVPVYGASGGWLMF